MYDQPSSVASSKAPFRTNQFQLRHCAFVTFRYLKVLIYIRILSNEKFFTDASVN